MKLQLKIRDELRKWIAYYVYVCIQYTTHVCHMTLNVLSSILSGMVYTVHVRRRRELISNRTSDEDR